MASFKWYFDPHQLKKNIKVGPPLTKLPSSPHVKILSVFACGLRGGGVSLITSLNFRFFSSM